MRAVAYFGDLSYVLVVVSCSLLLEALPMPAPAKDDGGGWSVALRGCAFPAIISWASTRGVCAVQLSLITPDELPRAIFSVLCGIRPDQVSTTC